MAESNVGPEGPREVLVVAPPDPRGALLLAIAGMRELQERGEGGLWIAKEKEHG